MPAKHKINRRERALHRRFSTSTQNYLLATLGMELHKNVSIPRVFLRTARTFSRRTALCDRVEGGYKAITYGELLRRVNGFASALIGQGISPRSAVAMFMKNQSAWPLTDLGSMFAGCLTVPIYETLSPNIIELILGEADVRVLVVENKERFDKIAPLWPRLPQLKLVVVVHPEGVTLSDKVLSLEAFEEQGRVYLEANPQAARKAYEQIDREDVASIVYTSGTTGRPKGVMLTHRNFLSNFYGLIALTDITHKDRMLSILPLSHTLERTAGYYSAILIGASIYYAESIKTISRDIVIVKPTICVAVPRVFEKIYASVQEKLAGSHSLQRKLFNWSVKLGEELYQVRTSGQKGASYARYRHRPEEFFKTYTRDLPLRMRILGKIAEILVYRKISAKLGGRIRYMISGGAPLSAEIISFFRNLGIVIYEGYGLTETTPIVAFNYHVNYEPGTVGHLIPYTDVRFSEQGEILVKGPNVMRGYFKNSEATREVIDEDGWFHTGDVGCFTDKYNLKITGRIKDLIVTSGGKKIPISPIETELNQSALVSYGMLLGDAKNFISCLIFPDQEKLHSVAREKGIAETDVAKLCERPEIIAEYEKLIAKVNAPLSNYERIKKFKLMPRELTVDGGEITPTMKLKRKEVLNKFKADIDGLYQGGDKGGD